MTALHLVELTRKKSAGAGRTDEMTVTLQGGMNMEPQKKPIHLNEMIPHIFTNPFEPDAGKTAASGGKEKILKPWQGLLVFAFLMVLFNLAGIPLVLAGGMYGNALDEIIVFLIGSILVVRALHIPLKKCSH